MSDFDERSGVIRCKTEWGCWWQTIDEVTIEIHSDTELKSKQIECKTKVKHIQVKINGTIILEGDLYEAVHADDTVWTLEDKRMIRICLSKSHNTAAHCWPSLLVGKYAADPVIYDQMQRKLTLQRFQYENPGMDFSGASLTGNYHDGGPQLPG
ncbi:nudC domain-containing protein 2-like [Physella acuta]|uniref:nudC domain-containing protein 2-like n=1 Tax=Physella acuta TaxID=109671 RepID=UPI0027DE1995|nr:nudC domain-containing protein 2-like [Physella acuta]